LPDQNSDDMKQRAISAFFFVVAVLGGIFGGYIPFLALFGIVAIGAGWEMMKLNFGPTADHLLYRKYIGAALASLPFFLTGIYHLSPGLDWLSGAHHPWLLTVMLLFPVYLLWMVELFLASERPFTNIGHYLVGIVYVGVPLALLIDVAMHNGEYVPMRVFGLLVLNWMNDTFAYLTGKMMGKTKFFPRISPNKTWEGTLGGIVCTMLVAGGLAQYWDIYTPTQWVGLAFCVAVFGTLGDLIESMLKRSVGVKDSGNIMPGHGGFLDRFDSFLFLLPFVWLLLRFVH
jgi:phosphatidate cytidylyltransferase